MYPKLSNLIATDHLENDKAVLFPAGSLIEVVGNVASGKSTTAKDIAKYSNLFYADLSVHEKNPFLQLFVKKPKRWTFQTNLHFSTERARKLSKALKKTTFEPLVLDPGFDMGLHVYSRASYLMGDMTREEWELLEKLHNQLLEEQPKIYATIFLDVPIPALLQRIHLRGRRHELQYSKKYLELLDKSLHEYKRELIALKARKVVITYTQLVKDIQFHGKVDPKLEKILKVL